MRTFVILLLLASTTGCIRHLAQTEPAAQTSGPGFETITPDPTILEGVELADDPTAGATAAGAPPVSTAPPGAPPAAPYLFRTTILDTGYEHPRLDAATQATISWENTGSQTHSVVSDDGRFAGSGPVSPGSSFTYTFQTTGDFPFHCRYHPDMKGLLVVR